MADTIEIVQGTATTIEIAGLQGPQGPQGATGSGLGTLTTQGDTLYQGASSAQRLPIGTAGQILKVNAGGTAPEWGAAPASGVSSVNTLTGAVVLEAADVDAAADLMPAAYVLASTDPAYAPISGYYYQGATAVGGKAAYYKIGTRENTSITFSPGPTAAQDEWKITHNAVVVWSSMDDPAPSQPWEVQSWGAYGSDPFITVSQADTVLFLNATAQKASGVSTKSDVGLSNVDNTSDANKPISTAVQTALDGKAAANHTHTGSQVNVGSTSGLPLKTGTAGVIEAGGFGTSAGTFAAGDDARFTDSRNPLAHKASHATGGTDALAPSDIGAQSLFTSESITLSGDTTLSAARAKIWTINNFSTSTRTLTLPTSPVEGDVAIIRGQTLLGNVDVVSGSTLATLETGAVPQRYRFVYTTSWALDPVPTHNHFASQITSGTLAHERGGLEADVSAYNGLVKIASGSTSAVTVTSAGEALLDDADASAQRTTLGAAASGSITTSGLTQATARILGRTDASTGAIQEISIGSGLSLSAGELSSTVSAGIPATLLDAKGDLIVASAADTAARLPVGATNGHVLTVDSAEATGMAWKAASGGVSAVDATTADVLSVSGSNLVADDGGLINSANPAIVWNDASGKLVYQNPLERPSGAGAMFIGLAPSTTALGSNSVNIQTSRSAATQVASGSNATAIGDNTTASGGDCVAIGASAFATTDATALGGAANANASQCTAIGRGAGFSGRAAGSTFVGRNAWCSGVNGVALGNAVGDSLRAGFFTAPFSAVYWGGQTTNNTATILNLDATATNRFTIAANTALAVDILLVARRSDVADKWLVARRFLGIRRNGSNGTALIGSVQTLGTDQSEGSPSWTFTLSADDTNEALQLEVTGATSETVQWRATAFYRVV